MQLVAAALGRPERVNWRNCVLSQDQEERVVEEFRSQFDAFDFSLVGEAESKT